MFLMRSRVRFDGCYISKITYIRSGENSFQDQSYRPWHLVEYYRYIFFTPHGQFFFLTTSESPQNTIPHLRDPVNQTKFSNLLVGHYSLEDHLIYGECWNPSKLRLKNKTGGNITYHLVLQAQHLKKRFNNGLLWMQYYVNIENPNGSIIKNEFDIDQVKFPTFIFSRVKSFTREAQRVLD
jgi:F-box protein 9